MTTAENKSRMRRGMLLAAISFAIPILGYCCLFGGGGLPFERLGLGNDVDSFHYNYMAVPILFVPVFLLGCFICWRATQVKIARRFVALAGITLVALSIVIPFGLFAMGVYEGSPSPILMLPGVWISVGFYCCFLMARDGDAHGTQPRYAPPAVMIIVGLALYPLFLSRTAFEFVLRPLEYLAGWGMFALLGAILFALFLLPALVLMIAVFRRLPP